MDESPEMLHTGKREQLWDRSHYVPSFKLLLCVVPRACLTPLRCAGCGHTVPKTSHSHLPLLLHRCCLPSFSHSYLFGAVRVLGAMLIPIADCDETFNFWEPLHYLLYGRGQQTWEYAPEYALRSYLYVALHAVVSAVTGGAWGVSKLVVFERTRASLALLCALCEATFCRAVARRFGAFTGAFTVAFMAGSAGMFHAGSAFLPSTFAMYCVMLGAAAFLWGRPGLAMGAGAVAAVLGWPFAGVVWVPMALAAVSRGSKSAVATVTGGAAFTAAAVAASLAFDTAWYRADPVWKFASAPAADRAPVLAFWNIIKYNVLGQGGDGRGSELYGVEPWTYYPANLALNFNGVAALAAASAALPVWYAVRAAASRPAALDVRDAVALLGGLWVWLAIMGTRPHKEERFMFVVYPLLCLAAALVAREACVVLRSLRCPTVASAAMKLLAVTAAVVSAMRIAAVVTGYSASMAAYVHLSQQLTDPAAPAVRTVGWGVPPAAPPSVRVCVGQEWYRFPSSFFLPDATPEAAGGGPVELAYLKSSFGGQLPQPFLAPETAGGLGTTAPRSGFNDANKEEPDRYVDVATCDYVVDFRLPPPHANTAPHLAADSEEWEEVWARPFLHAPSSPALTRALYIPGMAHSNVYGTYVVMRRVRL